MSRTVPLPGPLGPSELHERLAPVLAGLAFPAMRWQVVTHGDLYGCDGVTRELLARLPEHRYQSLPELVGALAAVLAGRVPERSGPVRLPPHRPAPAHARPVVARPPRRPVA